MMAEDGYNGWKNYETWAVALWIDNDQGTYGMRQIMAVEAWEEAEDLSQVSDGIWTREEAARFTLEDMLKDWIEGDSPLADDASLYSDLLGAALSEVDWLEIAANYLE